MEPQMLRDYIIYTLMKI